jgi:hypothetical protein
MTGTIRQIDDEKQGPLGRFIRVHFYMDNGSYKMVDLVKRFRNFKHWKDHLEIGVTLGNLQAMGGSKLDADPVPVRKAGNIVAPPEQPEPTYPEPPSQSKRHHGQPQSIPVTPSTTHKLEYKRRLDRWVCKCGYTLGDGREKFTAPCGTYHENKITRKPKVKGLLMVDGKCIAFKQEDLF